MQRKQQDQVAWLEFELFSDCANLSHGVFLRQGGVSINPYASLNLGEYVNDSTEHVKANQKLVSALLGLSSLRCVRQVHGKSVSIVMNDSCGIQEADAMITNAIGVGLLITHADCQSAIIYDPIHRVVANVHAGWRGSVQNIYSEVVHIMRAMYGSQPQDLLVGISPSLGPQNAEFIHYRTELPPQFWEFQVSPNHFDFWEISRWQLLQCGLLRHHIEIAGINNYAFPEDYFSYRREGLTGRNGTIVAMKNGKSTTENTEITEKK